MLRERRQNSRTKKSQTTSKKVGREKLKRGEKPSSIANDNAHCSREDTPRGDYNQKSSTKTENSLEQRKMVDMQNNIGDELRSRVEIKGGGRAGRYYVGKGFPHFRHGLTEGGRDTYPVDRDFTIRAPGHEQTEKISIKKKNRGKPKGGSSDDRTGGERGPILPWGGWQIHRGSGKSARPPIHISIIGRKGRNFSICITVHLKPKYAS